MERGGDRRQCGWKFLGKAKGKIFDFLIYYDQLKKKDYEKKQETKLSTTLSSMKNKTRFKILHKSHINTLLAGRADFETPSVHAKVVIIICLILIIGIGKRTSQISNTRIGLFFAK